MVEKEEAPAGQGEGAGIKSQSICDQDTRGAAAAQEQRHFPPADIEPWPEPVDGAALLDDLVATFLQYLSLPEGAAVLLALWVMFTHAFEAVEVSPRLVFTSPEPECGKTTALSLLGRLVWRPALASNISPAVIYRIIERYRPTLLLDEADTYLEARDDLAGILNSGHTPQTADVWRCDGERYEPKPFST